MARAVRRGKTTIVGTSSSRLASPLGGTVDETTRATTLDGAPNVQFMRPELRDVMHLYVKIGDCIAGQHAIKDKRTEYLPMPNATDQSPENMARYRAYLERAIFYNVTRRTVYALVGQIFLRDPQVDIPATLDVLKLDANGENVTLEQIAKSTAMYALAFGRAGLHVDYPTVSGDTTQAQLDAGDVRPIINAYPAKAIRNWRKALRGTRQVYTLIVVEEDYCTADDGFETKTSAQYKVMRLITAQQAASRLAALYPQTWEDDYGDPLLTATSSASDVYVIEVWRSNFPNSAGPTNQYAIQSFGLAEQYYPKGADGSFLNEIPWQFVGSEKNDDSIDHPPMADMAELNIGHYHNSADYEEACFIVGQPTPFVSGVTEEWNNTVLKGTIQLGSRGVIALPVGGTAGLLQAGSNTMQYEAMSSKERQMVALGAKLVEQRQVQRTATEAQMEGTADTSILAQIATNVSNAVQWAVKKCCVFTGDDPNAVSFILNTEFDLTRMDPAERQQLLLEWQGGAIAFEEMRANLRRGGVATLDDAEAKTAIAADEALRNSAALEKNKILNVKQPVGTQPQPQPGAGS